MGGPVMGSAAVAGAVLAFGTFGVPIKSRRLQASQARVLAFIDTCVHPYPRGHPHTLLDFDKDVC